MTNAERVLLIAIAGETDRIASMPDVQRRRRGLYLNRPRVGRDWIGNAPHERMARYRALRKLERAGLIQLHAAWGERTTHCELTEAGRSAVASLASSDASDSKPDPEAVQHAATHPEASQTPS